MEGSLHSRLQRTALLTKPDSEKTWTSTVAELIARRSHAQTVANRTQKTQAGPNLHSVGSHYNQKTANRSKNDGAQSEISTLEKSRLRLSFL
jgi:hypothetical protein